MLQKGEQLQVEQWSYFDIIQNYPAEKTPIPLLEYDVKICENVRISNVFRFHVFETYEWRMLK